MKTVVKNIGTPSGKRVLNANQTKGAAVKAPDETRWNVYYSKVERVIKQNAAIFIAQLDPEVELTAHQQLGPSNLEQAGKVVKMLKPSLVATKEAESDHAYISDAITLLKKLHFEVKK